MSRSPILILTNAIEAGDIEKARRLLTEHPALLDEGPLMGTWLHLAAEADNVAMVAMLVEDLGLDVNAPLGEENTQGLLSNAARRGQGDCTVFHQSLLVLTI